MEQRHLLVEGLFSLMYSTNSFTLTELLKNRAKLFSSYFKTDPETRTMLFKTFVELGADKYVRQMLTLTLSEVKIMQRQRELEVQAIEEGNIEKAINMFKEISAIESANNNNKKSNEKTKGDKV